MEGDLVSFLDLRIPFKAHGFLGASLRSHVKLDFPSIGIFYFLFSFRLL